MKSVVISRDDILSISRDLIRRQGWSAINIRSVAAACGVSVGSIYNYFESKADLLGAIVASVWHEIFHDPEITADFSDTQTCIAWIYKRMEYGCQQYPGFFTLHSLSFMQEDKEAGKVQMQQIWRHITHRLLSVLRQDTKVRPNAFSEQFTAEKLADVLFSLILSALLRQDYDSTAIQEIVRRTLY